MGGLLAGWESPVMRRETQDGGKSELAGFCAVFNRFEPSESFFNC